MKAPREDRVFLVRMWREGSTEHGGWRGSVHDVVLGRRLYLTSPAEIGDFITVALLQIAPNDGSTEPV